MMQKGPVTKFPTQFGMFTLYAYINEQDSKTHLALVKNIPKDGSSVIVRIHSECMTGDTLFSQRCDCGGQLKKAMERMARQDNGVLLYLMQEGRGIGLFNKLRAYELQDKGVDTVEANEQLGFKADARDYAIAAWILKDLSIKDILLLTNNPDKVTSLQRFGLSVHRVPLEPVVQEHNKNYLLAKKQKLGHML